MRSDRAAGFFVWSVFCIMILADLFILVHSARIYPLNEDWWLVPVLTGHEPSVASWLWVQNSEHRIPFPRLILLALLEIGHGDVRAGMLFNIVVVGALVFAMIRVARTVRGGRTIFADAFFPVALLHIGHAENLFWGWQLTQVVPTVLTCVILLVLVRNRTVATLPTAVIGGIVLVLLPLSGSHALLFAPLFSLWFGYCGLLHWRTTPASGRTRWVGGLLLGSAFVALAITGLHTLTYQRPSWLPADPSIEAALETAVKFLALAFGPTARSAWTVSMIAIIGLVLATAGVAASAVLRCTDQERSRAIGVLVFFGGVLLLAGVTGWGRATAIESVYRQYPLRYVLMAVPVLLVSYFIWELYGARPLKNAVRYGLFVVMCVLVPANTQQGLNWIYWFADRDARLEKDLKNGMSPTLLAERHREILLHWEDPKKIEAFIRMLRDQRIGPFALAGGDQTIPYGPTNVTASRERPAAVRRSGDMDRPPPSVSHEIRYGLPRVHKLYLVWQFDDEQSEVVSARGATNKDLAYTEMIRERDVFVANIRVPLGSKVTYGFMIPEKGDIADLLWPAWPKWDWNDGQGYHLVALQDGVTDTHAPLVLSGNLFSVYFGRYMIFAIGLAFAIAAVWGSCRDGVDISIIRGVQRIRSYVNRSLRARHTAIPQDSKTMSNE